MTTTVRSSAQSDRSITVRMEASDPGIRLAIYDVANFRTEIYLDPAEIAAALTAEIPGFTATYEKPIVVPQGTGAIVGDCVLADTGAIRPWWDRVAGTWRGDKHVADLLRNGAEVRNEGVTA